MRQRIGLPETIMGVVYRGIETVEVDSGGNPEEVTAKSPLPLSARPIKAARK